MPNVYEIVTQQVLEHLERGTVPWRQSWKAADAPRNYDGRRYSGVNVFLLTLASMSAGYTSPYWLTYKKAQALGGNVRKGESSTLVVFWKRIKVSEENPLTGKVEEKAVPMLRYYRVFNLEQCDGIEAPKSEESAAMPDHVDNVTAEEIMARYLENGGPSFTEAGARAFYRPATDSVTVPPRGSYETPDDFYVTAFHELAHSTAHPTRLDRKYKDQNGFGSHGYGREELCAEMTAAFLAAECNITATLESSAAYIHGWMRTIKEDTRAVVVAAGAAQKAADFILGRVAEAEVSEDHALAA